MTKIERTHTNARMSKIVRYDGIIFLCGQTAVGAGISDIEGQTAEVLERVDRMLSEAGSDRSRILSAMVHLKAIDDFAAMNRVWEAWVPPGSAPARTTVEAELASPELLVEVTVVAAATDRR